MELREYLRIFRRRWVAAVVTAAIVLAAAVALTLMATPKYSSTVQLFVSTQQDGSAADNYQGALYSEQRVSSYADLVPKSSELAKSVIDELGLAESPAELRGQVTAQVVPETVNLALKVTDSDPEVAQAKAQTYAEALVDLIRRLETPEREGASPAVKATIVDPANLPTSAVSPNPARNVGLGLILGALLGMGVAVLREGLDTSVKAPDDLLGATDAPLLGTINFDATTRQRPLVTTLDSHAPRVEAFRVLRTNLQFVDVDRRDRVFVVTSAVPEEGKTTTAVNLALALAQAGGRTLLIEGDLRRPKAAATLGLDHSIGVTTVLLGKVRVEEAINHLDDSGLDVLPSGAIPPNPAELLQSRAMADLLEQLRQQYDVIIIDAPPLLPVTDAALLAAGADGALLVVRHGRTSRDQVAQAVARLTQVDASLMGVVLNMVPTRRRNGSYTYGYGYGYGPEALGGSATGNRWPRSKSARDVDRTSSKATRE